MGRPLKGNVGIKKVGKAEWGGGMGGRKGEKEQTKHKRIIMRKRIII